MSPLLFQLGSLSLNTQQNFSYFQDEKNIELQLKDFAENSSAYCFAFLGADLHQKLNYRVPFFRILYIVKGQIKITLDHKTLYLETGSFIVANANTHITYLAVVPETEVLTMCFKRSFFSENLLQNFSDYPLLALFLATSADPRYHKSNYLFFSTPFSPNRHFLVYTLLKSITTAKYHAAISEAAFLLLLFNLDEEREKYLNIRDSTLQSSILMSDLMEYIQTHYQDISLQKLADTYHLHPNYLSLSIKAETGELFSQHLATVRMRKAVEFLINTKMPIEKISTAVGYSHKSYFFKLFKKTYGISPKQYRKEHQTSE